MPVRHAALRAAIAGLVLMVALPAAAARVVTVGMLTKTGPVHHAFDLFEPVAQAVIFYQQCPDVLGLKDDDMDYINALYQDSGRRVAKAYADGYRASVGTAPTQAFVDEYMGVITTRQQASAARAANFVRASGCNNSTVRTMHEFIQRYRNVHPRESLTLAPAPQPVQETPKPVEQPQPAAINETQPAAQ